MMGDQSNKVTDTSTVFKFVSWNDGVPQNLTGKAVTASIANSSGYLFDEKVQVNGTELDLDFSSEQLKKLTPDMYKLELNVTRENGNVEVYPSSGAVMFEVVHNLKNTQGELVPQITFDSVLQKVDDRVAEYVHTIAKGDTGPQGIPGKDGKFNADEDYNFNGDISFSKSVSGNINGTSNTSIDIQRPILQKVTSDDKNTLSFNTLNIDYIQKVQAAQTAKQNVWISHVTGYIYIVGHVNTPEDTVIFECAPDGTVKSNMLIKSDGITNIHGQNVVFDTEYDGTYPRFYEWYVDDKIRYSLYKPNTTINYLDMDVACIVTNTTLGHSFGIDFKNSRFVFWNIDESDDTLKKMTVAVRFFNISLQANGTFTINDGAYYAKASQEVQWTTDKNSWIGQGVSAIPKHAITNNLQDENETVALVYFGSATSTDNLQSKDYQYEIMFFSSDGSNENYYMGSLTELKNLYRPSVSQIDDNYSWGIKLDSNNNPFELTEMEAGNTIKTGENKYGFTFLMLASKGSLNMESFVYGMLDEHALNRIRYAELSTTIGKTKRVEPDETKLSNVLESGVYELSADNFNNKFIDKPQIFLNKDITAINKNPTYYSGTTLTNSNQISRGTITQTLSIMSAASGIMTFKRLVIPSFGLYGSSNKKVRYVSPWQYDALTNETNTADQSIVIALNFTEDTLTLKGFGSYISEELLPKFAPKLNTVIGSNIAGWFENSAIGSTKLDGNETFYQKYTTDEVVPSIYIRKISVTSVGVDTVYNSGYGGGGVFASASDWVKI